MPVRSHVGGSARDLVQQQTPDKYRPGSIYSIHVVNFLNYREAVLRPGAGVNLVIGTNGSGKSSMVNAVCLGLGGKLDVIGRSTSLSDFIRSGADDAVITIELVDHPQNIVIARRFNRAKLRTGKWTINGQNATDAKVKEITKRLNIQVDNLCSFLPQDKVPAFAKLKPNDLLRKTEETIGDGSLLVLHNELIEKQLNLQTVSTEYENQQSLVTNLEDSARVIQERVSALTEYANLKETIRVMKLQLAIKKKDNLSKDLEKATQELKKANTTLARNEKRYQAIKNKNQHITSIHKELEDDYAQYRSRLRSTDSEVQTAKNALNNARKEYQNAEGTLNSAAKAQCDAILQVDHVSNTNATIQKQLVTIKKKLVEAGYSGRQDDIDPKSPYGKLQKKIDEINKKKEFLDREARQINRDIIPLENEHSELRETCDTLNRKLERLDDVREAKLRKLSSFDPACREAMNWVTKNRSRFHGTVFDPIFMELRPRNQNSSFLINTMLSRSNLLSFYCTDERDYSLLVSELTVKMRLRISIEFLTPEMAIQEAADVPLSRDQLRNCGFEGYVLDLIECNEQIRNFLAARTRIHTIPYSSQRVDTRKVPDVIKTYVAEGSVFRRKVAYGEESTNVQRIVPIDISKDLLAGQVDNTYKQKLESELAQSRHLLSDCEQKIEPMKARSASLRSQIQAAEVEKEPFLHKLDEFKQLQANYFSLEKDIEANRSSIRRLQNIATDFAKEKQLKTKVCEAMIRYLEITSKVEKAIKSHSATVDELVVVSLKLAKFLQDNAADHEKTLQLEEKRNESLALVKELESIVAVISGKCKEAAAYAARVMQEYATEEEKRDESLIPPASGEVSELSEQLAFNEARLRNYDVSFDGAIQEKQENDDKLDKARELLASLTVTRSSLEQELEILKHRWLSDLQSKVDMISEKFCDSFASIGCRGEVELRDAANFSDYSLAIKVSFREDSELLALEYTVQSGGEKSFSTMMFLLAIQSIAGSPFRMVDEINQGVDSKNERKIYEQLLEIGANGTSQYFVVTPKLLPNVNYENITVSCVVNGPHTPQGLEIGSMLEKAAKSRAA